MISLLLKFHLITAITLCSTVGDNGNFTLSPWMRRGAPSEISAGLCCLLVHLDYRLDRCFSNSGLRLVQIWGMSLDSPWAGYLVWKYAFFLVLVLIVLVPLGGIMIACLSSRQIDNRSLIPVSKRLENHQTLKRQEKNPIREYDLLK